MIYAGMLGTGGDLRARNSASVSGCGAEAAMFSCFAEFCVVAILLATVAPSDETGRIK